MEENGGENTGTGLVVYSKFTRDIAKAVQKTASLSDLHPENRIVVPGEMFVASCDQLRVEPDGILGSLVLMYFKEVETEPPEAEEQNLMGKLLRKFFPQGVVNKSDLTHEGKNYRLIWRIYNHDYGGSWITMKGHAYSEAIGLVKTEVITCRQLLISNELLTDLFNPIVNVLLNFHKELAQF